MLASVNSLHLTIKTVFMQSKKLRWLSWKKRGINPFVVHKLYEESQKRKNLPCFPYKNSSNTLCEECNCLAADHAAGHRLSPMRKFGFR